MAQTSSDGTAALDKALDVLDAIGSAPQGLGQAELGTRLQLPRTTLYRLLATLVARGLVRRDPLRRVYRLGFRCVEYARAAYTMPDLVAAAGLELRGLRDLTGETSYLAVLDGREVLSLERCDGAHAHRSASALGERKPLHCTSQGKAILSALPEAEREALVKDLPLPAVTPRSITERRRLMAELRLTATRGYALDDEEIVPGVRCVGAPVVDPQGQVRGAISVAGPAFRLTLERLELLGSEVAQAARRIGAQLGSSPAPSPAAGDSLVHVVPGGWALRGAYPAWNASTRQLWWADTLAPAVHVVDGLGGPRESDRVVASLDSPIDAMLLLPLPQATAHGLADTAGGVLVSTQSGGWWQVGPDGGVTALAGWPRRRFSAVCADAQGQVWACVPDGERWRLAPLAGDEGSPHGWHLPEPATALAWQADGRRLVAVAPESGTLYTLTPGSATVRRLATVPKGSGRLLGLALDADGGAWCALKGGWSVARFAPDGSLDRVIGLPVPCPTGVALGGPAEAPLLCVPTAREGLSSEVLGNAPGSGRLLVVGLAAGGPQG
ncbi:IclR family transcriptional regulator domain-containing protein [Sphaerotilus hippei]|nr:IclR family transcriptional regulator C-terminal domain-containing protein [Sphaerotilus hippei]